ncbi:MAG: hypothetical protein ACR2K1_08920 [Saprospiraceae bacterium]
MSDLDDIVGELNSEIERIKGATIEGLLAAGQLIQAGAQDRVPVKSGALKASAYTRVSATDANVVEVGFEAEYALLVHEDNDMKLAGQPRSDGNGEYWGPNGASQFLTASVEANREKAIQIIQDYASA